LAQTSSRRLTWQHEKVSTMSPNTCQPCLRSKQKAGMTDLWEKSSLFQNK
jgi:hypothetical protein